MKKFLSVVLCLVLVVSALASCNFGGNSGGSGSNVDQNENKDVKSDKDIAKEAYDMLVEAEKICVDGMDDIYGAWYFGIYEADDCTTSTVFYKLSLQTSFSSAELENNCDFSASALVDGVGTYAAWQFTLDTVKNCIKARGDIEKLDKLLKDSKEKIQSISSDYEYVSDFKEYYTKVSSYAEFFKEPTGSFNQLQDTINDYENSIRTAKEAFKFDFE